MHTKKQSFWTYSTRPEVPPILVLAWMVLLFLLAWLGTSCTTASSDDPAEDLAEARQSLQRYEDVTIARTAGFQALRAYGEAERGYSGLQFTRGPVGTVDPAEPSRLIYRVHPNGKYELLGATWVLDRSLWDDPPQLFGQSFNVYATAPTGRDHGERALVAWLFTDNPLGPFSAIHPDLPAPNWWPQLVTARDLASKMSHTLAETVGFEDHGNCLFDLNLRRIGYYLEHDEPDYLNLSFPNAMIFVYEVEGPRLAGLQWRVPASKVAAEGIQLVMFGQSFSGPFYSYHPDHPDQPYYALTVWPYHDHPRGVFAHPEPARCNFREP